MKSFKDLTEVEDPGKLRDAGMKVVASYLKKFEKDFHKTLSSIEKASGSFQSPGVHVEMAEAMRRFLSSNFDGQARLKFR